MVLDIIDYIGDNILAQNPYIDSFGANCIKINDQVVNLVGGEKENFGPSDIKGIGSYVRLDPNITYTKQTNKFTSCAPKTLASMGFRLVVFQVNAIENKLHPVRLESKITSDLFKINWKEYLGLEQNIELDVTSSNLDFSANFREEVGKDYNVGADSVIIAINCTLSWIQTAESCECPGETSFVSSQVTIKDQSGEILALVACGQTYTVGSFVPTSRTLTINGVTYDLSADRSWTVGAGGGETLAQTLALGNSSNGNNIIMDDDDDIRLGTSSFTQGVLHYDNVNFRTILIHSGTGEYIALNDSGGIDLSSLPPIIVSSTISSSGLAVPTNAILGYIPNKYFIRQHVARSLLSQTAAQKLFDASTNGALTLPIGTYKFTCQIYLSDMSTTAGNSTFSIAGTAVTAGFLMHVIGYDNAPVTTTINQNGQTAITSTFNGNMHTASVSASQVSYITGTFEVTTAGTIIPSIALTTAAVATVNIGTYFEIECLGLDTVVSVGPWT